MTTGSELGDAAARRTITADLDRTLFVEAGAGSGKTRALVERIVALVLDAAEPVRLRHIAAVTFSEKAAAELRDRLRIHLEQRHGMDRTDARIVQALDDLDTAAIGTLHSFARRILAEHPVEAGLPPVVEVLDEVASQVAFDVRWSGTQTDMLDDPALSQTLVLAMAAGVRLTDLRSMTRAFTDNWDLIDSRVLSLPGGEPSAVDVPGLAAQARRLAAFRPHCRSADDKFLARLNDLEAWADSLEAAADEPARLALLADLLAVRWSGGYAGNWSGVQLAALRAECAGLATAVANVRDRIVDVVLRRLAHRLGTTVLVDARDRRTEGRLEFHDLLVLARDLLRRPDHGPACRTALQQQYQRILLDEFQDTDPIQMELALRIAGGAAADAETWEDIPVPDGSVFIVGDPKQSIYRFRRANIATYLRAQDRIGERVLLDTNFRTCAAVLDWVNHTFGRLILPVEGSQPAYQPLSADRAPSPGGPPVLALGTAAHLDDPNSGELRTREAADVAAAVTAAITERWQVDDHGCWRDAQLRDIAILVPARTSLPFLEAALTEANIPFQSEASSLVYRSREVRDLLLAARAADDPSDALALVSALRSPLFGCGDDDLWAWQQARGRWNILAPAPPDLPEDHPVADAVAYLRRLHRDSTWMPPSEILGRLVDERRMCETATIAPGSRDVWRRLRYVIDQARAWADREHGGLRDYLAWAARHAAESGQAAEAVLPETDLDAVRIMTIHAAKGLEFPIVVVAGMTTRPGGNRGGVEVLWPADGGCAFRIRRDVQTADFDTAKPVDEQMGHDERLRLLYVAVTRARDHLVVSLHRRATPSPARAPSNAELLAAECLDGPHMSVLTTPTAPLPAQVRPSVSPLLAYDQWHAALCELRARAARPTAVSASRLEQSGGRPAEDGLAKEPRDLELPPWTKGRYGTAIGRAVHGVLQTVDLGTGAGLADAVAAQVLAEDIADHADIVTRLALSGLNSGTVVRAAERPHWRETYVGTTVHGTVLEGVVDLLYRDDDGLVIVDYKTDAVPDSALDARAEYYRPQLTAYAAAVAAATGEPVQRCLLLFLGPDGCRERELSNPDIDSARLASVIDNTMGDTVLWIEGRAIYLSTGPQTQTINLCTADNVRGRYETAFRLPNPSVFVTEAEVGRHATLAELQDWLLARGAREERRPGAVDDSTPVPADPMPPAMPVPTTAAHNGLPHAAPAVLSESWLDNATRTTELAIDSLLWEFVENPYLHRVEESLHARLFGILAAHPIFAHLLPIGTTGEYTQPVHKEWPETIPRPEKNGKRGRFDLAVLNRDQLASANLDDFAEGRIPASIVIELGLNYSLEHLSNDHAKLANSRVRSGFLLHFSRDRKRDVGVERFLLDAERQYRTAYAHHAPDGTCTFKTLDGELQRIRRNP